MLRLLFLITGLLLSLLSGALAQLPAHWQLSFAVKQYDHDRYNQVLHRHTAALASADTQTVLLETSGATWKVFKRISHVAGDPVSYDVSLQGVVISGKVTAAAAALEFRIDNWTVNNFVFTPGSTYNGNRFESRRIDYSPRIMHPKDAGVDAPLVVTDIPRLNKHNGPSRMQLTSGAAALPCIGYHDPAAATGMLIISDQGNRLGDYGMDIEENRSRNTAWIAITSPHVRELTQYHIANNQYPSSDKARDFETGDSVTISCRVYQFPAPGISAFYNRYFRIQQEMIRPLTFTKQLPFSAAYALIEDKFNRMNWHPAGYYAMDAIHNNRHWKPGWVSGMPAAYALWLGGKDTTRHRVIAQNNWAFPAAIAPSGFFWERGLDGVQWIGGDYSKFHTQNWHLVRSSADALFYTLRLLQVQSNLLGNQPDYAAWQAGAKRVADSFVRTWNRYRQFGHFVHSQTGEIVVGGSASGGIVPADLVLAYQFFHDTSYLRIAREAGTYFYNSFIAKGFTTGGPGDALQNPDSESCYGLLESYMALYEVSKDAIWLQYAEETARLLATWVMPYHYRFPAQSTMGKISAETGGTVWANTQNRHGGPGICTASGLALLKLYRTTGNSDYMELLRVIAQSIPQYVSRPDRPVGQLPPGCVDERIATSDWLEGVGEIPNLSTWAEIAMMLTAVELPGIYIQRKSKTLTVLDHVNAKLMEKRSAMFLQVENPTIYKANVRIVVDENELPLSANGKPLKELVVEVEPGKSIEVKL